MIFLVLRRGDRHALADDPLRRKALAHGRANGMAAMTAANSGASIGGRAPIMRRSASLVISWLSSAWRRWLAALFATKT
jgi:hypothetical protein